MKSASSLLTACHQRSPKQSEMFLRWARRGHCITTISSYQRLSSRWPVCPLAFIPIIFMLDPMLLSVAAITAGWIRQGAKPVLSNACMDLLTVHLVLLVLHEYHAVSLELELGRLSSVSARAFRPDLDMPIRPVCRLALVTESIGLCLMPEAVNLPKLCRNCRIHRPSPST